MKKKSFPPIIWLTLLLITVASACLDYFLPEMGDDLSFHAFLGLENYTIPNRKTISFILAHIFGCNGRFFDYMGPIVINLLPRCIAAIVMGAMGGLFFYSIILSTGIPRKGRTSFTLGLITVTLAVIPWWDLWLRVCQFNYTWGATFCLLAIYLFFNKNYNTRKKKLILGALILLGICAGGAHEQTGISLSATLILWGLRKSRYKILTHNQKAIAVGVFIGTFLPIGAPSFWGRVSKTSHHEPIMTLVQTTLPLFFLLLAIICLCLVFKSGRKFLKSFIDTDCTLYLIAGLFSAIIALASGIPGRTGLFSEACAIVVIGKMLLRCNCHINNFFATIFCSVCILFITSHFAVSIIEERKLYSEHEEMVKQYIESADGIIYMDYTTRYEVSPITLNRIKGIPDSDDNWNRIVLMRTYRSDNSMPNILPAAMKGKLENLTDSINIGYTTVYSSIPKYSGFTTDSVAMQNYPGPTARVIDEATLGDGRRIWIATPWIRDPGDYELPLVQN